MRQWVIVAGLGFGDEGKGTTIDWLCKVRKANLVVRYNGGPQALHYVVSPEGKMHGFRSFGSGTFSKVPTLLSSGMVVSPTRLQQEATFLSKGHGIDDIYNYLFVSENAPLLLDVHATVTRALESCRPNHLKHGTTGVGIAAVRGYKYDTGNDPLRIKDLKNGEFKAKLLNFREWANAKVSQARGDTLWRIEQESGLGITGWIDYNYQINLDAVNELPVITSSIEQMLLSDGLVYFEGAQGFLLDEHYGFFPHVTWADTTFGAAMNVGARVNVNPPDSLFKLGVIRSYHTRHGIGPLPSERAVEDIPEWRLEKFNGYHPFMGHFRIGEFEYPLYTYARHTTQPHGVMMTHLDHAEDVRFIVGYNCDGKAQYSIPINPNPGDSSFMESVTANMKKSITLAAAKTVMDTLESSGYDSLSLVAGSYGPTAASKQFLGPNLMKFLDV